MSNIRIPLNVLNDDQNVTIKLEQDFDNLETLSLSISSSQAYSRKSADFGVVVGRVVLNNGFGVQNAKVSVFVPIKEADKDRPEIFEIYPFTTSSDTLPNGIRYNLLPRVRNGRNPSHRAVGNFPDVTDLTNYPNYLEVFETYYKYTTRTNESGDFMLFGVPLGAQDLVMDFDVFDTTSFEVTANDLVATTTQNGTISDLEKLLQQNNAAAENTSTSRVPGFVYKGNGEYDVELKTNLNEMPNIFHQVRQINVAPFWGDTDLYDIGITRCDFNVDFKFQPTAIFFGHLSSQTNSFSVKPDYSYSLKRKPEIFAKDEALGYDTGDIYPLQTCNIVVYKLDDNNNPGSRQRVGTYTSNPGTGYFRLSLPMYMNYFTTNEYGDLIPSNDPNVGIPTQGNYCFEIYETNDAWRGTRNVWGGYTNSIIPGIRVPSSSTGDKWLGGWGGTWDGVFQYDLFNKKRKFYTIATKYRRHDAASVLLDGTEISYFPQINQNKTDSFWNFPLDYRDVKHLNDDPVVIGSCMIPRVQMIYDKSTKVTTFPTSLLDVPYIPKEQTYERKIEDFEWFLGIGSTTGGLNNGPVYDKLFSGTDFMVTRTDNGTTTTKSIYGEVETFNWGDNTKDTFNDLKSQYAIQLAQKQGAEANAFSVFQPYTQVISSQVTTGVFVNASDYQVGKLRFFEVGVYDITDEIQDLVVNKVYSSYQKSADLKKAQALPGETLTQDDLGANEIIDNRGNRNGFLNKLITIAKEQKNSTDPGTETYYLNNMYNGKFYFFGYWQGLNALYDIETNYFNVIA